MLDCGTKPEHHSIENMYNYMSDNIKCGGCSGEVEVSLSEKDTSSEYVVKSI